MPAVEHQRLFGSIRSLPVAVGLASMPVRYLAFLHPVINFYFSLFPNKSKETNTYSHLVEEGITGNPEPEAIAPEELRDRVWQIVEPIFHQKEQQAIARYQELAGAGTGKASNDIKEIISAAYFQRVDSLIVPVGRQMWGGFDPDTMSVDLHPEPEPADEDMLDFAAIHTLLNGGTVYAVQPEQLPEQAPAAAIFRY
jgi:hypothetical protein